MTAGRRRASIARLSRRLSPVPVVAAAFVSPAMAGPPSLSQQAAVAIPNPAVGSAVFNLRDVGAIAGSGPIQARVSGVFVNDESTSSANAEIVQTTPGAVCVRLTNFGLSGDEAVAIELTLSNLGGQIAGPQRVALINTPGAPVTNDQDPACSDPNTRPVAAAGADQTVADTDGQPGEPVTLNGAGSTDLDPDNALTYVWTNAQGQQIATGASASGVALPDGVNVLTLTVTDDSFDTSSNTASDSITVTVLAANQLPTANGGGDRSVADTDTQPGENVTLDGSQSTDPDGTISTYQWFRQTVPP
ncbi:MAG TPA: REJ domain-containing protein, partial [Povalibacter sp.]